MRIIVPGPILIPPANDTQGFTACTEIVPKASAGKPIEIFDTSPKDKIRILDNDGVTSYLIRFNKDGKPFLEAN